MNERDVSDSDSRTDPMAPPTEPCECYCLHCGRTFMSDGIWFQRVINARDGFEGFWMCPTPNCDGAGFCFDIFPTDPDHPANLDGGWVDDDDEDFSEFDPDELDDSRDQAAWDPDEPKYKQLDEDYADEEDDDIEGEEWKLGLQPGESPPEPEWAERARQEWEQEQKKYDQPDERPRVQDWKDREDLTPRTDGSTQQFNDDDIPFLAGPLRISNHFTRRPARTTDAGCQRGRAHVRW